MANTKVTTNVIADGSITTATLADDAVTAAKIVAGAVIADVASNSITLAKMAANSIDSDQYVDGSIDTAHIAASQITNALMADDAIDSAEIVDGAIDLAHMSANSIDSDQYVDGSIDTAHIAASQITNALMADDAIGTAEIADDVALGGNPTTTTQSAGNSTTRIATTAFVATEVANLIDSSPGALNTLNELAAAIGDDASFSTTITNSIATKLPLAGGTLTGNVTVPNLYVADDIGHTGDSDTYLSWDANNLSIYNGCVQSMYMDASEVVVNNASGDIDFRVESNNNANMLFVDGGSDSVGIGTNQPSSTYILDVAGAVRSGGNSPSFNLREDDASSQHWAIGSYSGNLAFRDVTGGAYPMTIEAGADANSLYIDDAGKGGIGTGSPDNIFHIHDGSAGSVSAYADSHLIIETAQNNSFLSFLSPADKNQGILFGDATANWRGQIQYNHNGDYMALYSAATERMRIDSSGNTLHTVDSQGSAFDASDNSTWNALEIFQDRGVTNSGSGIAFRSQSGTNPAGIVSVAGNTTGGIESLAFITSASNVSAERLRITSDGNVGIGTASPSTSYTKQLHVHGSGTGASIHITDNGTGAGNSAGLELITHSDLAYIWNREPAALLFGTNATERMRIGSTGKASWAAGGVGTVGTQARDFTFYTEGVTNGVAVHSNDHRLIFMGGAGSGGAGMDTGYFQIENAGTAKIALNSNGNSYFNGGNVGIGNDSPAHLLSLKSTGDAGIHIAADSDNTTETDNPYLSMSQDGSTAKQFVMAMESTAGTAFTGSLANAPYIHADNHADQPLMIAHEDELCATFRGGKTGIGTSSPDTKLDVEHNSSDSYT